MPVPVDLSAPLRLDHFLKITGVVPTGGVAKVLIQAGDVQVNGVLEDRRGRKLAAGDQVSVRGMGIFLVQDALETR